jgi:hypothetical protein
MGLSDAIQIGVESSGGGGIKSDHAQWLWKLDC